MRQYWFVIYNGEQIGLAFNTKEEALQWAEKNLKKGVNND